MRHQQRFWQRKIVYIFAIIIWGYLWGFNIILGVSSVALGYIITSVKANFLVKVKNSPALFLLFKYYLLFIFSNEING